GTPVAPGTPPGALAGPRPHLGGGVLPRVQDPDIALLRRLRDALEAAL
ncbi:transcriptional regulator, partial [Streptomyces sp. NEAU-H3]|nr:transcriptional regulator [Streptomyces sp. NEAU-H3]